MTKIETAIRAAMDRRRIIEFSYYGTPVAKRFAPYRIVKNREGELEVHGRYYHGNRKHDAIFRLSKMSDIIISSQTFRPAKGFEQNSVARKNDVYHV
ncbi:WYL domain-containing protein (plasmid) [Rhizobium sp. TH2]|uniref:WYL domain-containing protein n=1 Tax=Rhizobium sp. TH2 TaxID=2775403 RepID=UPI0021574DC2|nr:WYL domain-containing protein [Rhizobium sp. TH2]UVC12666.1 WYL domain-containing protein [Rhizobium sp. TH2]